MYKKPKVLFLLHLPPPVHGAAMVGQYIKDSSLINNELNCRYINLGISTSINDIGKTNVRKFHQYLSILYQLLVQLLIFKPQLCYLTITAKGSGFYKDFPLIILARIFKRKIVIHFHNKGVSDKQDKFIDHSLYKLAFKNVDVILLSKYLYSDVQKYVPEKRVHYCSNGIPEKASLSNIKESVTLNKKVEILFLSNLIEAKGVFVLIDACKILHEKQIPFHCTIVGSEGSISAEQLQSRVTNLGLNEFIQYVGRKYGTEKDFFFTKADIFAFPSYNETFGLVILEAMQFLLPVISTFEGGIPEIIEDGTTGFLIPQKNVEKLAEKLETLICDDQLRKQMGAAGRAKYEKEFTLNIFEEKLQTILNCIICENN